MRLKPLVIQAKLSVVLVVCGLMLICYVGVKYAPLLGASHLFVFADELIPRDLEKYLKFSEGHILPCSELSVHEVSELSTVVGVMNQKREVFNLEQFGAVQKDTTMLVVQVHRDAERLQYLVVSLAQVRHIETALVIFSHSFFDDSINSLIRSITFCRYMQIFNPFSIQLNPSKFPGVDPADCLHSPPPRTHHNCSSRDARRTERKHHWWWQAQFVFNHLEWSPQYKGTVVFLEEDDYVLPDLLYMLNFAKRAQSIIPGLNVIAFGNPYTHKSDYDILKVDTWQPAYHKGMAFNKTIWKKIFAFSSYYCTYDDINWSHSLFNLFTQFHEGHTDMLASKVPRVVPTSSHVSGKRAVQDIYYTIQSALLFPHNVKATVLYSSSSIGRVKTGYKLSLGGNGGWSDIRDHLLCMNPYSLNEPTLINTSQDSRPPTSQTPKTSE